MKSKTKIGMFTRHDMVELFREGWTVAELATKYRVNITTIREHLEIGGVSKSEFKAAQNGKSK
jgi:uncharacterized protein (DUF433 family)